MKRMGISAIYRRPNTSKPAPGHKIYPYLLRGVTIERAEPSLGDGHHLHPDGARLCLSGGGRRLVQPAGPVHGGCRSRWRLTSASRRWRRLSPGMASRRSSTPTRAANSRASRLHRRARGQRRRDQHGRKGRWRDNVFVERLWRVAQVRGGLSESLRHLSARRAARSACIWPSTTAHQNTHLSMSLS